MKKSLVILGNGFDKNLGLKTGYWDYFEYTSGTKIKKYIESYSKRVDNELTALQLSIGININEVNSALDGIINDAINEYAIINAIDSITYINEDIEAKIRLFVSNEVAIRLSDTMINKLKLFYKSEAIPDLIAKRIFLNISLYAAKNNSAIKSVKGKK